MSPGIEDSDAKHAMDELSAQYPTSAFPVQSSFDSLKERIRSHYELCSDYYYSLGEHIHHGYFLKPEDSKEIAQIQLVKLLLERSGLQNRSMVLDVGCGIGGTSRYLAREHECTVTGITISGNQVQMARRLSKQHDQTSQLDKIFSPLGDGQVRFIELDAEKMGTFFRQEDRFDVVWISEAMSHLPDKQLFFSNAFALLKNGGKLVIADWFKAEKLTSSEMDVDIKPIEEGMLLPPLCTQQDYVNLAKNVGFEILSDPLDISGKVSKTWDISISLVSSPSLWALAFTQGRDFIAFLQAFRAMRRGFANATFCYAVMSFRK